jgi:hypothetical protein
LVRKNARKDGDNSSAALFSGALETLTNPPEQPWARGGEEQVWPRYAKCRNRQIYSSEIFVKDSLLSKYKYDCFEIFFSKTLLNASDRINLKKPFEWKTTGAQSLIEIFTLSSRIVPLLKNPEKTDPLG